VVVVSAGAHRRGRLRSTDLNLRHEYQPSEAYAQSKLANLLFARELARKTLGNPQLQSSHQKLYYYYE
jgi:NAD(P)-dependent dehydrogenase (short-subunit alcohol dehydrogenase family)